MSSKVMESDRRRCGPGMYAVSRGTQTPATVLPGITHALPLRVETSGTATVFCCAQALSGAHRRRLACERFRRLLRHGAPVTIALQNLGEDAKNQRQVSRELEAVCQLIAACVVDTGYEPHKLGLCICSHTIPLPAFARITQSVLGTGPRYVLLDSLLMTARSAGQGDHEAKNSWHTLWQARTGNLQPAYGGVVRSACSLLSDELAPTVLPRVAAVVPQHSAWVCVSLALTEFIRDMANLDWRSLEIALAATVHLADGFFESTDWPCNQQTTDAALNRRLAVSVSGIGEIIRRTGRDPRQLETLRWVNAIIERVKIGLRDASRSSARHKGPLPALSVRDPSRGLRSGAVRDNWRRRWEAAVREAPLRHRNMLVLSPQDVLPAENFPPAGFEDLLPVLRHADAWCFPRTARYERLGLHEYETFHRRAWAVIRACTEGCVVAARGSVI